MMKCTWFENTFCKSDNKQPGSSSKFLPPNQNTSTTTAAMAAESLDQLLNAEFKEAFDEFDKVRSGVLCIIPI